MEKLEQYDEFLDDEKDDFVANSREWVKLDESIKNEGFRIGKEKNQEEFLQRGFNSGFKDGIDMSIAGGKLQGRLCAYLTLVSEHGSSPQNHGVVEQDVSISDKNLSMSLVQKLLSSTSELLAQIPNILSDYQIQDILQHNEGSSCSHDDASGQQCCSVQHTNFSSLDEIKSGCSVINTAPNINKDTKQSHSCPDVCLTKAQFWSQLENLHLQATAAGVIKNE